MIKQLKGSEVSFPFFILADKFFEQRQPQSMSLSLFFRPVEASVYEWVSDQNTVFKTITVYTEKFPNYAEADIALIGLGEHRGSEFDEGMEQAADAVRKALYRLKKGSGAYKVVDLGNLVNGHSLEETYGRVREVCEALINLKTFPILIGGSHDLDYGTVPGLREPE